MFEHRQQREQDLRHDAIQACVELFATRFIGCETDKINGTLKLNGSRVKIMVVRMTTGWSVADTLKLESQIDNGVVAIVIVDGLVQTTALEANSGRTMISALVFDINDVISACAPYCVVAARAMPPQLPTIDHHP